MNIAKGIKGIRKILANDTKGWHVTRDDIYLGYMSDETVTEIVERMSGPAVQFTAQYGNGLHFVTLGGPTHVKM